jgi:tryptophan synthase beta chain
METTKFLLSERDVPEQWYNIVPDLPSPPPPPLHPATHQPIGPEALAPLFPMELVRQEVSQTRYEPVPDEVREVYELWRPTPLIRARRLEKALGTPAHIYYKYEGVSPAGSHKPNTAVPQAFYNKQAGITRISTETGAGQWGSALAMACNFFGLDLKVYMVKVSYEQKPYRRSMIRTFGGEVVASPSPDTAAGRAVLAEHPDSPGSLGIAISEAVEDAVGREDTHYALGSVLNHVCLHQSVIGQESLKQMELAGEYPDVVIGCAGGGSNFAGIAFPFLGEMLRGGKRARFLAVEPDSCPSLTRGEYVYDFGDLSGMTPLMKMYTLGHDFVPSPIHAGGLRYHGMAPLVSHAVNEGLVRPVAYPQLECFQAAVDFAASEGIVPGPEPSHAIRAVLEAARQAEEEGREKVILFNLSGHGHFDMQAYDDFLSGRLQDHAMDEAEVARALAAIESFPKPPVPAGR